MHVPEGYVGGGRLCNPLKGQFFCDVIGYSVLFSLLLRLEVRGRGISLEGSGGCSARLSREEK